MLFVLAFLGLSAGLMIAGGIFTTLMAIGLIPHFSEKTHSQKYILLYEDMIVLGTVIGNLLSLYPIQLQIESQIICNIIFSFFALFSGIFIGCLAISIAEILNTMPIFAKRLHLRPSPFIIPAMALGKLIGSLYYFFNS